MGSLSMQALAAGFAETVARWPDATAVEDGSIRVTYAELDAAATAVTIALVDQPAALVGLRLRRSWRALAAMIGVCRSGRAYVPIDPAYPAPRQDYIIQDARLSLIIEDDEVHGWRLVAGAAPQSHQVPADCAYVIYTSGSTGEPKGVMANHTGVRALLDACTAAVGRRPGRRWSVFHSFSFDFSVWEIWGPLLEGGTAVLVSHEQSRDPALLAALLEEERVNLLSLVPSAFTYLTKHLVASGRALPDLQHVVFGGEAIRPDDLMTWWRTGPAPTARMVNMYGITETTVHATYCELNPDLVAAAPDGGTPIGRALGHLRIRLMDADATTEVPNGEPGQIVLSGAGVTQGYLGRPDLTAARFPLIGGERSYLSGDWAVRGPDGGLRYLGRHDDQVKLHGHRIELGEVETAVRTYPGIVEAACTVESRSGMPDRLVALIVTEDGGLAGDGIRRIRPWLAQRLPRQLVPARVVAVPALPVSPSGKLARRELASLLTPAEPAPSEIRSH